MLLLQFFSVLHLMQNHTDLCSKVGQYDTALTFLSPLKRKSTLVFDAFTARWTGTQTESLLDFVLSAVLLSIRERSVRKISTSLTCAEVTQVTHLIAVKGDACRFLSILKVRVGS